MRHDAKGCSVPAAGASAGFRDQAGSAGSRLRPAVVAAAFAGCAVLGLPAGGCSDPKVVRLESAEDFQRVVLEANKPALVHFWKGGCALCGMLAPIMNNLAGEYEGRAVVAEYMLMSLFFASTSPELRDRYGVAVYPTAILFVNGREVRRWTIHYEVNDYRKALDAHVSPVAGGRKAAPATTAAVPGAGP